MKHRSWSFFSSSFLSLFEIFGCWFLFLLLIFCCCFYCCWCRRCCVVVSNLAFPRWFFVFPFEIGRQLWRMRTSFSFHSPSICGRAYNRTTNNHSEKPESSTRRSMSAVHYVSMLSSLSVSNFNSFSGRRSSSRPGRFDHRRRHHPFPATIQRDSFSQDSLNSSIIIVILSCPFFKVLLVALLYAEILQQIRGGGVWRGSLEILLRDSSSGTFSREIPADGMWWESHAILHHQIQRFLGIPHRLFAFTTRFDDLIVSTQLTWPNSDSVEEI